MDGVTRQSADKWLLYLPGRPESHFVNPEEVDFFVRKVELNYAPRRLSWAFVNEVEGEIDPAAGCLFSPEALRSVVSDARACSVAGGVLYS